MKKLIAGTVIAAAGFVGAGGVASAAPPDNTGPGDCAYGKTHEFLARSGKTGSVHFPGIDHKGASGFCEGMPNY